MQRNRSDKRSQSKSKEQSKLCFKRLILNRKEKIFILMNIPNHLLSKQCELSADIKMTFNNRQFQARKPYCQKP